MKVLRYIVLVLLSTMMLSSCSVTRSRAFSTSNTQLNIQMADLEYLGDCDLSVEYRQYLGCITAIDTINGVEYDRSSFKKFNLASGMLGCDKLYSKLERAAYKLMEEYPEADYFIITNQVKEKDVMFLGSHNRVHARVKVYSIK